MKLLKLFSTAFIAMIVIAAIAFHLLLNSLIKKGIESLGPKVTQTAVTLEKVKISPFSGSGEIRGLIVGNPEGFKTPSAFKLGRVSINLEIKSLFSNRVIINEILIKNPQVTYEATLGGSNIKQIKANVESITKKIPGSKSKDSDTKSAESKKVEIGHFNFEDGNVQLSAKILQGNSISVPLPTVSLTDIGKDEEGSTLTEAMRKMLIAISDAVLNAIINSGKLGEVLGDSSKNIGGSVKKSSSKVVGGLKKLFGKENK